MSRRSTLRWPRVPHRWNLTPKQAIRVQQRLAARVLQTPLTRDPVLVAGADAAFSPDGLSCVAAIVVWHVHEQRVVEEATATRPVRMPYVPGLLSFREAPAIIAAIRKLTVRPDVLMFDAHGFAHPRRFGLASHVGVVLDCPSIGCAKSLLCGTEGDVRKRAGFFAPLRDKRRTDASDQNRPGAPGSGAAHSEIIGSVVRTQTNVKPVYVSVGHRITLDDARRVVMACCTTYRLPEPTRRADHLVSRLRSTLA